VPAVARGESRTAKTETAGAFASPVTAARTSLGERASRRSTSAVAAGPVAPAPAGAP
jgi:hypothetical protein